MKHIRQLLMGLAGVALVALAIIVSPPQTAALTEQQNSASATSTIVPRLIKFSGTLLDEQGHPLKGPVGVTFALYAQQAGGAALWLETQNVEPDANGNYTVLLGAASADGVPMDLFASGEARWLGVQAERQLEQPRVLLVSVPYALKAGDAQTLGGLPVNAFALAGTPSASASSGSTTNIVTAAQPAVAAAAIGGTGTTDFIPLWTSSTTLGNSILFQAPSNSIGIGTTAPAAKLDVNGGATIRGQLSLPFTGTATSTLAFDSQPFDLLASTFNSSTHAAVPQNFRWQAEPLGNNTASPSGKLNLLFASGTATPAETGLSISNKGIITFAPGQTLPTVTGNETVNGNITDIGTITATSSGFGIQGNAVGNTLTSVGVSGTSNSSTGIGVEGTFLGTTGSGVGIQGLTNSASGVAGRFRNIAGGPVLEGLNPFGTSTIFSVDSSGNLFGASSLTTGGSIVANGILEAGGGASLLGLTQVKGNSAFTNIGDPGCGPGFGGIGFALFSGCNNYSMVGDGTNTYVNAGPFGALHFRLTNGDAMIVNNNGRVGIGTTTPAAKLDVNGDANVSGVLNSGNLAVQYFANNTVNQGGCLAGFKCGPFPIGSGMMLTESTATSPVFVMANVNGILTAGCVNAVFSLMLDGTEIARGLVSNGSNNTGNTQSDSLTLMALATPAPGSHTFEVQETEDETGCHGGATGTNISLGDSSRVLIVREW